MNIQKRTSSRPPRPPVPKFRMTGAGTDTPDFLPPPRSEDSLLASSVDDNTSSEEHSTFARKRLNEIKEILSQWITKFSLSDEVQKCALNILSENVQNMKQKKYDAIAVAMIIAAVKKLCLPLTLKEILKQCTVSEKQVKKLLSRINVESQDHMTEAFIKQICTTLHLNEKFLDICGIIKDLLEQRQLIHSEHQNVIAAAIVKLGGDIIFQARGGINPEIIADVAKCSLYSLKMMLRKIKEHEQSIATDLMQRLQ